MKFVTESKIQEQRIKTMSRKTDLLSVVPSSVAPDRWKINSSHLIGYDHVCGTEVEAKGAAVLVAKISKAQSDELSRLLSLTQELVDAGSKIRHWHDTHNGGMIVSGDSVQELWSVLDKAEKKFNIAPTNNG